MYDTIDDQRRNEILRCVAVMTGWRLYVLVLVATALAASSRPG